MTYKSIFLFAATTLFFCIPYFSFGQYNVEKVANASVNTSQDGFYYALPQTVLKVEMLVEKIQRIRGPLAEYAENYLGVTDYISTDNTTWKILDVNVEPQFEADPSEVYYVRFPAEKSKDGKSLTFRLSPQGTLLAFDDNGGGEREKNTETVDKTMIIMEGDEGFRYFADYHRKKKVDTITRKITIDTVSIERFIFRTSWVDKSAADKADEAARQITAIREARFNLLTGYQEVNYGESIRYMDYQLNKLERSYMELFLGKEVKTQVFRTVYYVPEKGNNGGAILKFDNGQEVKISVLAEGNTSALPEKPLAKTDNIYYRIPDIANVEVMFDGSLMFSRRMPVSQLGVVATAPIGRAKTQFDPLTGALISITRD